nr:MAG TPA: hypothetical protein [Caudoviricetes sp.]
MCAYRFVSGINNNFCSVLFCIVMSCSVLSCNVFFFAFVAYSTYKTVSSY